MVATLSIRDETPAGVVERRFTLAVPAERMSIRELIRASVRQRIAEDQGRPDRARAGAGAVDPERQAELAADAFLKRQLLVLVGGRQAASLDEVVDVHAAQEITFVRLVPLVGG